MNRNDIQIRTHLLPGDLGYVAYLHGKLYSEEFSYGTDFERYVIAGLHEFGQRYDPAKDRIWVCEHQGKMVGFLMGIGEGATARLRYFILLPEFRGCGLGKKLMELFMEYLAECGYRSAYLWTTNEQLAAASLYKRYGFKLTATKASTNFGKPLREQRYDLVLDKETDLHR